MPDEHSERASAEMAKADLPFWLTSFQELELVNAIWLRVWRRQVRSREAKAALAVFRKDIAAGVYFLKPFSATVFERGLRLAQSRTRRHGVRTLDLLHLAAALEYKARQLYSFDERQRKLAVRLGLRVSP